MKKITLPIAVVSLGVSVATLVPAALFRKPECVRLGPVDDT
jgi:hypothetical protein